MSRASGEAFSASTPGLVTHFERVAGAPGGVARLRELILSLAVRGKLVPQDPGDEPASVLLQRIRAEKDRLPVVGNIRRARHQADINQVEWPFDLPKGWVWARLGFLGDWGAGATPSRTNSRYYGGSIPWFKSGELTADYIGKSEETVTEAALRDCSLRYNQVGDVLVAMYGATIGKTAILSVSGTTNQAVCACTPSCGLQNTYLLLLLKALKPYFTSIGAGGAQPNISREKIIATVVGLPPLPEQSRIVIRVDELMRLCDALEAKGRLEAEQHSRLLDTLLGTLTESATPEELAANWQRVAEHFDLLLDRPEAMAALEQTILQLAVRGLLVPQDLNDEPASALLDRIRAEKVRLIAEGKIKKDKPLPPISDEEKPFELPAAWEWVRVGQISSRVQYGVTASADPTQGVPKFVRITDIQNDDVNWDTVPGMQEVIQDFSDHYLASGDLLIARTGGTIGKSFLVVSVPVEAVFASYLIRISPSPSMSSDYLKIFASSGHYWSQLYAKSMGTGQPNVNGTALAELTMPLPPIAEQARIVARVTELRRLCADLRQRLSASQATQSRLAEALVESVASA